MSSYCLHHEASSTDKGRHNAAVKREYLNKKVTIYTYNERYDKLDPIEGIVTRVDSFGCIYGTWGPDKYDPDVDLVEVK